MFDLRKGYFYPAKEAIDIKITSRRTLPSLVRWVFKTYQSCPLLEQDFSYGDELEPNEVGLKFYEDL